MNRATLEDAIALAVQAHHGQRDKAGQPYSRRLKLADVEDNMDVRRLNSIGEDDERLRRYVARGNRLTHGA